LSVKGKHPISAHPISAVDVEVGGSDSAMNVRYFFPTDDPLRAAEKKVTFRMQVVLGDIVEAEFALKDMVFEGKQAISDGGSATSSQH